MSTKPSLYQSFAQLSAKDLEQLAKAIIRSDYEIVPEKPAPHNRAEGIYTFFNEKETHEYILGDSGAVFNVCVFSYESHGRRIGIPVGVFGISAALESRYPFILGSFCYDLLMLSRKKYEAYGKGDSKIIDEEFLRLVEIRSGIIKALFKMYYDLGDDLNSVMGWEARGKESNTRKIAETFPFHRNENPEIKSEIYSKHELSSENLARIRMAGKRWRELADKEFDKIINRRFKAPRYYSKLIRQKIGLDKNHNNAKLFFKTLITLHKQGN